MNQEHLSAKDGARSGGTRRLVGTAVFTAIVVVLQLLGSFIKVGPVSLSLVLAPIVIGAAMYGAGTGAFLGFVFSAVVAAAAVTGADQAAFILWTANPVMTLLVIFLKGTLAGWLAGLVYRALAKKSAVWGAVAAAAVCPVVNTGIFCAAMLTVFRETLASWAGGTPVVTYVLLGLAGVNFLVEMVVNMILSPVIVRILRAGRGA